MTEEPPLTAEERGRLRRRQRWMIGTFVAGAVLMASMLYWPFGADLHFYPWLAGVSLLVVSALLQFFRRCPRCGTIVGIQSRLRLPDTCRRCGVALRE